MLLAVLTPDYAFAQCPPEVTGLPADLTINNNDQCSATVTWTEPSYSLDCDDFSGLFAVGNWALNTNGGDGTLDLTEAPDTVSITGSDGGPNNVNIDTDYCITIPHDGNINFDWTASIGVPPSGAQLRNDEPAYTIDGVETRLNVLGTPVGNNIMVEMGSVTNLAVTAGQEFCFRIRSNNRGAEATLDAYNFSFEIIKK